MTRPLFRAGILEARRGTRSGTDRETEACVGTAPTTPDGWLDPGAGRAPPGEGEDACER